MLALKSARCGRRSRRGMPQFGNIASAMFPCLHAITAILVAGTLFGCGGAATVDHRRGEGDPSKSSSRPDSTNRATSPATLARFLDKTASSGVDFTYRNGQEAGHLSIVESLGGGVALFDYDGDGLLDVFVPGGGGYEKGPKMHGLPPVLYRNEGNWRFRNVTKEAGLDLAPYYSHGAAVGDYDNDGWPDILVTGYGGLLLFRNQGDATFQERALADGLTDRQWSSSGAWGDLNGDGTLDLYVAHYANWSWENHPFCKAPGGKGREVCPPRRYDPLPDTLYFGTGDGRFRDGTKEAGLKLEGKGLGVVIADLNLDRRPDVYVGNDTVPNLLYQNLGSGRFKEIGLQSGTSANEMGMPDGSMGVDVGDFNRDGLPDLWVTNYERESFALYRNEGNMNFTHVSLSHGVTAVGGLYVGWGTVFLDFDRDGDEDVFVSNGHVIRYPTAAPLRQKPLLLQNEGGKRFVNVAPAAGGYLTSDHMGRGVAAGDIDNDGDTDLAVCHTNEPVSLLSNESKTSNGWLSLRLIGTTSSRDPVGARVRVETRDGKQVRQVKGGTSYASSSDPRLLFGLGKAKVKSVTIHWPSGRDQTLGDVRENQFLVVVEGRPALRLKGR